MALTLEINGTDYTAKWRPYESHWTRRAYMGESAGESEFVLDDVDGTIDHANLATYKVLRVFEGGFEMFKGRITTKRLGRGPFRTGVGMQWIISAADANYELRGIRITDSHRPEESDRERVLAYRFGYLNGPGSTNAHARDTTVIDGAFVPADDLVTLPAEDYRDTFPDQVFLSITEISAKTFFVFTDGDGADHLYYASHTDTQLTADITLTDAGTADGVDSYAPDLVPSTGIHDGLNVITGAGVRYGEDEFYEDSDVAGGEADHDKFEDHFTDEYLVNVGSATAFVNNIVAARSNEEFTFTLTWKMRAEHAHRMQAGYITSIRVASANLPTPTDQRATQVTHTPLYPDENGDAWYAVQADFGLPRGRAFRRNIRRKPDITPRPAQPDVPAEVGITFVGCNQITMSDGDDMTISDVRATGAQLDDLILVHVSTDSDSTIPTAPSGWTAIGAGGSGTNVASRGFWHIYTGTTTDFDFGSGNSAIILAYRGIDQADPIGSIAGTGAGSTTMTWPALSGGSAMEVTDGTSWVVAFGHSKSDATVGTDSLTADDVTNRCSGREGDEHGSWDTDGGVSSWASHTLTVSNDQWQTSVYEIRADQAGTGGEDNDGPAETVGTPGTPVANHDHGHAYRRTGTPTVNDDSGDGYRRHDIWYEVDDYDDPTTVVSVWVALDVSVGSAEWEDITPGGVDLSAINFLVGTASGLLSAEIAVGTTPGGELGGTWASPTVDATHSGSAHHTRLHNITDVLDHSASGLTTGHVLTATGATTFAFQAPTASGGGVGPILITDTPAGSPLVFDDLLQNDDGTDLLYQDI